MAAFLDGVTVLELGHALAGPFAGTILTDLGARVIKVEPLAGDAIRRRRGPDGVSYPFEMVHRSKLSTAIDIKTPQGVDIVLQLIDRADIVIENFRPGVLKRCGLDAESALKRRADLVYCSISGFGQTGPMAVEGGVDLVAQGMSGLMSVTGHPGGPPAKAGFPIADLGGGMWAAIGVLAALHRARATGVGAALDIALADSVLAWAVWETADMQMNGDVPGPLGSAHRLVAPYQAYECEGGQWITVAGLSSRWRQFCDAVGAPEATNDPLFASETERYRNRDALDRVFKPRFKTARAHTWLERLRAIGIPCGPINSLADCMQDPQFAARDMWRTLGKQEHSIKVLNTPIRDDSDGAPGPSRDAPACGADTRTVLAELGFVAAEIEQLIKANIVAEPANARGA